MKRKNVTRNALITSIISVLLCVSMLVGTTFAWFTDSVASGSNVITSGNLDIEVQYTLDGENWADLNGAENLFSKGLWEPGHTEVVVLKIENKGSLALKYVANMNIIEEVVGKNKDGGDIVLSDILTVKTVTFAEAGVDPIFGINIAQRTIEEAFKGESNIAYGSAVAFKNGNVLEGNEKLLAGKIQYVAIEVDMAETVGNEANHDGVNVPSIEFGVNVLAAQFTYENDSFGNQYDANAEWTQPVERNEITTLEELRTAAEAGGEYYLADNITIGAGEVAVAVAQDFVLHLDGYSIDASAMKGRPFELADEVDFTINGEVYNPYARGVEDQEVVKVGLYGLVNIPAGNDATVTLNGGKYVGKTDAGSFIKPRGTGKISITMNDVVTVDESTNGSCVVTTNGYTGTQFELTVNGGYYEAPFPFDVPCINIQNATIVSTGNTKILPAIGIQYPERAVTAGALIENCTIQANVVAICVGHSSEIQVKDSTITALETGYALQVLTSGGTINAEGVTYTGMVGTDGPVDTPALIYVNGALIAKYPR